MINDPAPFAGTIKTMKTYDENGKCTIDWDYSEPLVMGTERMRIYTDDQTVGIGTPEPPTSIFSLPNQTWATVDKDLNVTYLDMELCARGPQNAYTALALAVWNKAIETAADNFEIDDDFYEDDVREYILRNKKCT